MNILVYLLLGLEIAAFIFFLCALVVVSIKRIKEYKHDKYKDVKY